MLEIQHSVGLGAVNDPADVRAVKQRLVDLGFDWLTVDGSVGPVTVAAIRLFQAMKNGLNVLAVPQNDGRVDPDGQLLRWLNATNAPRWVRMREDGPGFVNFEVHDASDNHDFGSSWLDDTIADAGKRYKTDFLDTHPDATPLTINDTSKPRGGDTPMHHGHEAGMCCDVRLPRKDGEAGGITTSSSLYDRAAMRAQIRAFRAQPLALRVFLIDDVLNAEGICVPVTGHDNHAHFEIKPPVRKDA